MALSDQLELPLIPHTIEGEIVSQRQKDGYINATAMCKAAGKQFNDYARLGGTKPYLVELSSDTGIPVTELIQSFRGGRPDLQGSWVHPQVAINLAQWLSPKFAVQVSKWVHEWMSGGAGPRAVLPFHLRRYVANMGNVPSGHFSVLTEMTIVLVAPLEIIGYHLPERLWPDISQGKMFARFMREQIGIDTDAVPSYRHDFEDGRMSVWAKAYPNQFLHMFRDHLTEVWMPQRALPYFEERDPKAVPFLKRVLGQLAAPEQRLRIGAR